jgi:MFS family permease
VSSIGAELYTAELIPLPLRYKAVGYIGFAGVVGMVVSLMVAEVVLSLGINWRIIFWLGAIIALIGSAARVTLRESPDFSNAKRRLLGMLEKAKKIQIIDTQLGKRLYLEKHHGLILAHRNGTCEKRNTSLVVLVVMHY